MLPHSSLHPVSRTPVSPTHPSQMLGMQQPVADSPLNNLTLPSLTLSPSFAWADLSVGFISPTAQFLEYAAHLPPASISPGLQILLQAVAALEQTTEPQMGTIASQPLPNVEAMLAAEVNLREMQTMLRETEEMSIELPHLHHDLLNQHVHLKQQNLSQQNKLAPLMSAYQAAHACYQKLSHTLHAVQCLPIQQQMYSRSSIVPNHQQNINTDNLTMLANVADNQTEYLSDDGILIHPIYGDTQDDALDRAIDGCLDAHDDVWMAEDVQQKTDAAHTHMQALEQGLQAYEQAMAPLASECAQLLQMNQELEFICVHQAEQIEHYQSELDQLIPINTQLLQQINTAWQNNQNAKEN